MEDLHPRVLELFERLAQHSEQRKDLRAYDSLVKFSVLDGHSFVIEIKDGTVSLAKEQRSDLKLTDITLEANKQTFTSLFNGEIGPTLSWLEGKLYIPDMPCKFPKVAWLMRLIRIGNETARRSTSITVNSHVK